MSRELVQDLWWFIDNMAADDPERTERFFALRERVRAFYSESDKPGAALGALRKTRKGWPKGTPRGKRSTQIGGAK